MFSAKSIVRVRAVAIVIGGLLGLLLSASTASAQSVPKAICGPGDHTESGFQGQTTTQERSSGDSEAAFNCNLQLVGEFRGEGAFSQDGPAYADDCAYFATDRDTPRQQHHGITVIDASDPTNPVPSAYLNDTAAALIPHETVVTDVQRHLLVVAQFAGPDFAVYDISDCRHPVLKGEIQLPGSSGHMGALAPDGLTYYLTQNENLAGTGTGSLFIVDLTDPSNLVELNPFQYTANGQPHGLELNPAGFAPGLAEGTRVYAGQPGSAGDGPDGLVIEDVSDYQFRLPNPQIRIISKLFWTDQGEAEPMIPVTIHGHPGHPYLISTDEGGGAEGPGGLAGACARGQALFGYPQIIDVSDETNPQIIAHLRLEVSDPANCLQVANSTPPDLPRSLPGTNIPIQSGTINYSEERCVPDNPDDARMMVCSFQNAGLRVFDIRDPQHAKEIAYWKPGAVRTEVRPSSGSWKPGADRTVDKIAGWARWVFLDNGQVQLWTVSDGNGFQVLRFTDNFIARNSELFNR